MIARCIALGLPIAPGVSIRTIYEGEPSHIRPWAHFTSFLRSAATPGASSAASADAHGCSAVNVLRHVRDPKLALGTGGYPEVRLPATALHPIRSASQRHGPYP